MPGLLSNCHPGKLWRPGRHTCLRGPLGAGPPRTQNWPLCLGVPAQWAGCSILGASFFFTAKQLIFLIDWRSGSGRGESGGEGETPSPKTQGFTPDGPRPPRTTLLQPLQPRPRPGGEAPARDARRAAVWRPADSSVCSEGRDGGRGRREAGRGGRQPGRGGQQAAGAGAAG